MTTRKPKKRLSWKTTPEPTAEAQMAHVHAIKVSRYGKTLADVARNVRPIPTVKQIEADVKAVVSGMKKPKAEIYSWSDVLAIIAAISFSMGLGFFSGVKYQSAHLLLPPAIKKYCSDYAGWYWSSEQGKCVHE